MFLLNTRAKFIVIMIRLKRALQCWWRHWLIYCSVERNVCEAWVMICVWDRQSVVVYGFWKMWFQIVILFVAFFKNTKFAVWKYIPKPKADWFTNFSSTELFLKVEILAFRIVWNMALCRWVGLSCFSGRFIFACSSIEGIPCICKTDKLQSSETSITSKLSTQHHIS